MKKYKLVILLSVISISVCYSQREICFKKRDSFYHINVILLQENQYPIFTDAAAQGLKLDRLKFDSTSGFLESLYAQAFYVPQMPFSTQNYILKCLGDSLGSKYLKENELKINSISAAVKKNSYILKYELTGHVDVVMKICWISGTFWEGDKSSDLLLSNSNEVPLKDIRNISKCFIPFDVRINKVKNRIK